MLQYDKEKVMAVCQSCAIDELYQMYDSESNSVLFIIPRKLTKSSEMVVNKMLQNVVDYPCCVASTESDITDKFCIIRNGVWIV